MRILRTASSVDSGIDWWVRYAVLLSGMTALVVGICRGEATAQPADDLGALNRTVRELRDQGRYSDAIPIAERYVSLARLKHGERHTAYATALAWLATLYRAQGRLPEAEPLMKRSLSIYEATLGRDHLDTAASLNNLALLYRNQGRLNEAEPLYRRSLAIAEKARGPDDPNVATALHNLASVYRNQGRLDEAEPLMKRSLAIYESALGRDHFHVAGSLNNLALLYRAQGRLPEAETLAMRSLVIYETTFGSDHPEVASSLTTLAAVYQDQGRLAEAEAQMKRSLAIYEAKLGRDHPYVAWTLNNLAFLAIAQGNSANAFGSWRNATANLQRRAERGLAPSSGGFSDGEPQRLGWFFKGLIKSQHRLAAAGGKEQLLRAVEMFEAAQWGQGSEAAASLAQMTTRSAKSSSRMAALVRERQDLAAEWQAKDKALIAAKSDPPSKRNVAGESALNDRLAAIDARLAEIPSYL